MPTNPITSPDLEDTDHDDGLPGAHEALAALRSTLEAMPADSVRPFRANVAHAVAFALRVHRSYQDDRPRFVAAFKRAVFVPEDFDDLETRALALHAADVDVRLASEATRRVPGLVARAVPLRRKLLRSADYLWGEDPVIAAQITAIRQGHGHVDLGDDVIALAALYEGQWGFAQANSVVTRRDITDARSTGLELLRALTADPTDVAMVARRDLRERAGTWLQQGVETVRAAAGFVFRDEPERLEAYPSLYTRVSSPRRKKAVSSEAPEPVSPAVLEEPVPA